MACSRCGASKRTPQIPSGVRAGAVSPSRGSGNPSGGTPTITRGVRETITGLRYVPK